MSRVLLLILGASVPCASVEAQTSSFTPRPMSPFATQKAEQLLQHKLPCLGCHRLDGNGGRIGPDLSTVGARRSPQVIYTMLRDPSRAIPGTMMPQTPMPAHTLELIASYLAGRTEGVGAQGAAPAGDTASSPTGGRPAAASEGQGLYVQRCAPCHGAGGNGDGFNAAFLPISPTVHSDSTYMATRPDDALFDAIYAGGYVMNKSNRMPAFGQSLTNEQIRSLVRYMRELCRCAGPAWSRDGQRNPP